MTVEPKNSLEQQTARILRVLKHCDISLFYAQQRRRHHDITRRKGGFHAVTLYAKESKHFYAAFAASAL